MAGFVATIKKSSVIWRWKTSCAVDSILGRKFSQRGVARPKSVAVAQISSLRMRAADSDEIVSDSRDVVLKPTFSNLSRYCEGPPAGDRLQRPISDSSSRSDVEDETAECQALYLGCRVDCARDLGSRRHAADVAHGVQHSRCPRALTGTNRRRLVSGSRIKTRI